MNTQAAEQNTAGGLPKADREQVKKTQVIVSPNTHWDREWRYPLWRTRQMLVEFMDNLLAEMDKNPEYSYYFMDGQSVPVEDYLKVRPEMEDAVRKHVGAGHIALGPWYTAPDLYPLDGECLVRNMLKGIRVSQSYGSCLKIAYTSFGWGQTAQFPQIYKGFGIDYVMASKKVSEERAPMSEFLWESPDGTRLLTTRLGNMYRNNYFFSAYIPIRFGVDYCRMDAGYDFDNARKRLLYYRPADADRYFDDGFVIDDEETFSRDWVKRGILDAFDQAKETVAPGVRLMVSGTDYAGAQRLTTDIIHEANEQFDDMEFRIGTLDEYFALLEKEIDRDTLNVVKGELRDGRGGSTSANALSTRMYLKTLNKKAQNVLIRQAEPLASAMGMIGARYPKGFFDTGWEYLFKSHPHDSINGVTQDKTADDVEHRLKQVVEIGDVLHERATAELVRRIDLSSFDDNDVLLVVTNSCARPHRALARITVDFPQREGVWDFTVIDDEGREYAVQHLSRQERVVTYHDEDTRPFPHYVDRHVAILDTGEVPALGYTVLKAVPGRRFERRSEWSPHSPNATFDTISRCHNTLENEFLTVTVNPDGTFDLADKRTGASYAGLNYFEDTGDVGDYWSYYPPYGNRTFTSPGCPATIWLEENG
ncbi:MAG: alpha-mannosidase, partial [Chitinivibrionales bacterium]|nr:alpha-mannosidase [Chitinivibrionales bacterium]MBD3394934.1 alpha-mannosidase [Chitinivibrionales bacterium]